jgi:FkbH-like protein
MSKLKQAQVDEYFLYPQIHWNAKSSSIRAIATALNIGIDTLAFVDDQPFELEEVAFSIPDVLCINVADIDTLLERPELKPRFITDDSARRRLMYMSDARRSQAEETFQGPQEEFLATLGMCLTILPAQEEDLRRVEELTIRTHQLNTTGYTYSYEELNQFRQSDKHRLFIAGLEDKYGSYGKIGVILLECLPDRWTIKLLLMSCRVMSRGVGTVMVHYLMSLAKRAGVQLQAEFLSNNRNRMMLVTYKFCGFHEVGKQGELVILENDLAHIQPFPHYMKVYVAA